MIECGFCGHATDKGTCSYCGRDPELPWVQRAMEAPPAKADHEPGRPKLDKSQVTQRVRIALKELGGTATNAALAEKLDVSETTASKWRKLAGL